MLHAGETPTSSGSTASKVLRQSRRSETQTQSGSERSDVDKVSKLLLSKLFVKQTILLEVTSNPNEWDIRKAIVTSVEKGGEPQSSKLCVIQTILCIEIWKIFLTQIYPVNLDSWLFIADVCRTLMIVCTSFPHVSYNYLFKYRMYWNLKA